MNPKSTPELASEAQAAVTLALRKLGASDKFASEIREALQRAEFGGEAIEAAISWLVAGHLLDDLRVAEEWVTSRSPKRAKGLDAMRDELLARGAPESVIDRVLSTIPSSEIERAAEALAIKFLPSDDRNRAARFLISRGFAEDDAESALDRFFGS